MILGAALARQGINTYVLFHAWNPVILPRVLACFSP
jgi:hypothetical protein